MHIEIQNAGVEILADFHIARDQCAMGERLRHVASARKSLFRINFFPVGFFHAAEFLRGRFLAREIFVALDFPAVGAGLDEVAGIRAMAPGRLADGAELVLLFVRSQIFVSFIDLFFGGHAHAPVIVHGLGWRVGPGLVHHQHPRRIGMLEGRLAGCFRDLLEGQQIGHHRERFPQIAAFHVGF